MSFLEKIYLLPDLCLPTLPRAPPLTITALIPTGWIQQILIQPSSMIKWEKWWKGPDVGRAVEEVRCVFGEINPCFSTTELHWLPLSLSACLMWRVRLPCLITGNSQRSSPEFLRGSGIEFNLREVSQSHWSILGLCLDYLKCVGNWESVSFKKKKELSVRKPVWSDSLTNDSESNLFEWIWKKDSPNHLECFMSHRLNHKGLVQPKIIFLSFITHLHVVPNL